MAFERPVVGAQSLQSLAGMMYSGGVTNGRCAHADDGACICYFTLALMCGEHLLAGMVYNGGVTDGRCAHTDASACICHSTLALMCGEHLLAGMMYSTRYEQ